MIPIVMIAGNAVAAGLAASLARPGGVVTGFTLHPLETFGKLPQLLKEAAPATTRMAALWNPATNSPLSLAATEEGARTIGVQLRTIEIAGPDQIPAGFEAAVAGETEALVVLPDVVFWNERARIIALAAKYRLPAIYPEREYADDGGLLAYGPNVVEIYRRAAGYVDKTLEDAEPADLPIQLPTRFEMVVNLKTAKALGLTIPPAILALANEVIE